MSEIPSPSFLRAGILHGAGYTGGELIRLLLAHPRVVTSAITSRSQAGKAVGEVHSRLRGQIDASFIAPEDLDPNEVDVAFVCAEHGQGTAAMSALREGGFDGVIIDLSADHRLSDPKVYRQWYGVEPSPWLDEAVYGLSEVLPEEISSSRLIANPGCFATALSLALWPLAQNLPQLSTSVTGLTGASGSGGRPSVTTHFPAREGNLRAYNPLAHRHLLEVTQLFGEDVTVQFVPVSGPWTRGIWLTAHISLPDDVREGNVATWFEDAYGDCPLIRYSGGVLPELLPVVETPFCDIGWVVQKNHLVVGAALDNLLKGAASQAVQNLNLTQGWAEGLGLIPSAAKNVSAEDAEGIGRESEKFKV